MLVFFDLRKKMQFAEGTYAFNHLSSGFVYGWLLCVCVCVLFARRALPHSKCRVSACCVYVVPGRDAWTQTVASALPFV